MNKIYKVLSFSLLIVIFAVGCSSGITDETKQTTEETEEWYWDKEDITEAETLDASAARDAVAPNTDIEIPGRGLLVYFKADAGITKNGNTVSEWLDQSGYDVIASQTNESLQPELIENAVNDKPAMLFDGKDDFLSFEQKINGLSEMTIFLVSSCLKDDPAGNSFAENAAIFWNETSSWATVYLSPFQSHVKFRFGTTQTGNRPSYERDSNMGEVFTITCSMKNQDTDTLFVNGIKVLEESEKEFPIVECRDDASIGMGYNDNSFFMGNIAEIIVYGRALTNDELQSIDKYLKEKYGIE